MHIEPQATALVICDVWNQHWCGGANRRLQKLAARIEHFSQWARSCGFQIIHAPSDTMPFYRHYPERKRIAAFADLQKLPQTVTAPIPLLPVDSSDGGCDTEDDVERVVWTRENLAISIEPGDVISDDGNEILGFLRHSGVDTILYAGVHANMCLLDRSFGIVPMRSYGLLCLLIKDLIDIMYNPRMPPHVSRDVATEMVIEYIKLHFCRVVTTMQVIQLIDSSRAAAPA
jgi:hypothetical protein